MNKNELEEAVNGAMDKAIGSLLGALIRNGVSQDVLQKSLADMMDDMEPMNELTKTQEELGMYDDAN